MSNKKIRRGYRLWQVDLQKDLVAEIEKIRKFSDPVLRKNVFHNSP